MVRACGLPLPHLREQGARQLARAGPVLISWRADKAPVWLTMEKLVPWKHRLVDTRYVSSLGREKLEEFKVRKKIGDGRAFKMHALFSYLIRVPR